MTGTGNTKGAGEMRLRAELGNNPPALKLGGRRANNKRGALSLVNAASAVAPADLFRLVAGESKAAVVRSPP